ncbi:MAG: D-glycero-beta-D-manno-heptose-7-phosphate kinase [Deferribacteraceae bacterium]|nr:D-glycero-beta-D-manno-heptose-7-phosphate kinase [Deferribacteraceae bacterium]
MNIADFGRSRILVIGDIILDKYIYGSVSRISPEAPVPVVKAGSESYSLGGAANVSANIAALKAEATLLGAVGEDEHRAILEKLLKNKRIIPALYNSGFSTTAKIRVIGEHQQIVRIDYEDILPPSNKAAALITEEFYKLLPQTDAVIISDYGKGVVSSELSEYIMQTANSAGKPVIVDPKGADWGRYRGAFAVTPNVRELSLAAGYKINNTDEEIIAAGKVIRKKFNLTYLIVTRSEMGISVIKEDGAFHIPTQTQEVFDVSGAGDTVVGVLACAAAVGCGIEDAVYAANLAAGLVIKHMGTVPVDYAALSDALGGAEGVISAESAENLIKEYQKSGKKVVFTNGCFDILHRGHMEYLAKARQLGDLLILGLNGDASVKRLKGESRPVNSEADRAYLLLASKAVDKVVIFNEDTPRELLSRLKPDILVKGGDYKADDVIGREYAGKVVIIPFVNGYSTTEIIDRLK